MNRAVVVDIKGKNAYVMTDDCKIEKIAAFPGMYKGFEVVYEEKDVIKKTVRFRRQLAFAASFLFIVITTFFSVNYYSNNMVAYAYVSVDVNPSVQLVLNKNGKVISVETYDAEGTRLVNEIDVKKKSVEQAVDMIVDQCIKDNYLKTDTEGALLINVASNNTDQKKNDELAKKLETQAQNKIAKKGIKASVNIDTTNFADKKKAENSKLSIGKYKLYENLKKTDKTITVEQVKKEKLVNVLQRLKEKQKQLNNNEKIDNEQNIKERQLKIQEKINKTKIEKEIIQQKIEKKTNDKVKEKIKVNKQKENMKNKNIEKKKQINN